MEETTAPDTDTSSVSARLLEAAHSVSNTPDPFASITLADIAARIDKPESSILYQIEPRGDVDALTIFRQLAYVRVVERFDTGIGRSTHEAVLAALASRVTMPQAFAAMCAAIALQFRTDPATPYLLGARARSESNPALAATIDSVWERLTSNLVDLIQLVLAANQQHLDHRTTPSLVSWLAPRLLPVGRKPNSSCTSITQSLKSMEHPLNRPDSCFGPGSDAVLQKPLQHELDGEQHDRASA